MALGCSSALSALYRFCAWAPSMLAQPRASTASIAPYHICRRVPFRVRAPLPPGLLRVPRLRQLAARRRLRAQPERRTVPQHVHARCRRYSWTLPRGCATACLPVACLAAHGSGLIFAAALNGDPHSREGGGWAAPIFEREAARRPPSRGRSRRRHNSRPPCFALHADAVASASSLALPPRRLSLQRRPLPPRPSK